jgi:hypothetical protein
VKLGLMRATKGASATPGSLGSADSLAPQFGPGALGLVGIVNPPDAEAPPRHYRMATEKAADRYVDPDQWVSRNPPLNGSW